MAGLQQKKIKDSYKSLLRVDDDTHGIDGSLANITDGEGTAGPFQISSTEVSFPSSSTLSLANLKAESATQGFHINLTDSNGDDKNKISIPDNVDTAFSIKESGNLYMKFTTTNGSEIVEFGKDVEMQGNLQVNGTIVGSSINFNSVDMTNVDIDSGTIDGTAIGSESASTGAFTTISASGNVDFNGDLDVDGTANLDVVDIDGAVDMANTLAVGDVLTVDKSISAGDLNTAPIVTFKNSQGSGHYTAIKFEGADGSGANTGFLGYMSHNTASTRRFVFSHDGTTRDVAINGDGSTIFNKTISVGASNGSEEVKANRIRVRHIDGLADASDYSHGDLFINHISSGNIICSSNVGIGQTNPTTKLHLSDGANTAVIAKFTNDTTGNTINDGSSIGIDGDGDLLIYNVENKEIKFYTNDTQRAVIDNSGSVGINYSTPSSMNDSGNNLVIGSGASGDNTGLTIFSNSDSSGSIHFADGTSGDEAYRGIVAYTHSSDAMRFFTSGTEKMRIASDGSVGIHTTSPNIAGYNSERGVLTISSTDNGSANNYANLELQGHAIANDVTLGDISWFDHTNQNAIVRGGRDSSSTTGFLAFFTNGGSGAVERMRITSGGNIIAGGGAPEGTHSERLGVKCLSRFGIFVSDNMSSGTTTIMRMYDTNATTVVGSITSTSSGTAYNTFSDYRLKENEVLISDGLTRLNQLKPYRFNFKTDTDTTVDGFFAHEVSEVVPEAITGKKDAVDDDNNIVPQGIDQSKLVPLLVKALQEADDKIDALTARIEALEA